MNIFDIIRGGYRTLDTHDLAAPARKCVAVTPDNSNDLPGGEAFLYIGGAGDVEIIAADDTVAEILKSVPAGTILPISVKRVRAAGTTATFIKALRR